MGAGVIKFFKNFFYEKLVRLYLIDSYKQIGELTKAIIMLDAITWARDKWDDVLKETITTCFNHCRFIDSSDSSDFDECNGIPLIKLFSRC